MNWDQIEIKWAAMTRRIRADYDADRGKQIGRTVRAARTRDSLPATIADSVTAPANEPEFKTAAK